MFTTSKKYWCCKIHENKRTGYTLADFVPTTDLDEIYIYESLIFPYINIFKFVVSHQPSRDFRLIRYGILNGLSEVRPIVV